MYAHVIDLDPCKSTPCQHGGICGNSTQGFKCKCDGILYEGRTCSGRYYAIIDRYITISTNTYVFAHALAYINVYINIFRD